MGDLHFYTNPQSRGCIVRWMLEETGVPYETHLLAYGGAMKTPDYLAVNRMGKVPAIRHGEAIVTEVAAICTYLAEAFPEAGLGPTPDERPDYYRWMFFAAGPLEELVTNHEMGFTVPQKRQGMMGYGRAEDVTATLEEALTGRPYICGDHFRAVDIYFSSQLIWCFNSGAIEKRPVFEAYADRVSDRPALKRATSLDEEALAAMKASAA
ncbi:glutathione S-transferase family protein [Martelella radicis]|uniref:Glutathione S-transferase n=1 Tax=Martelella radicis TaxID=1397476 RepID=A0A7W6P8C3_9HYPH|nr:glutathione S-transferase family protein [Martelella radicis]MBB4120535.1 glutathione S-transferase [Martelella radicis]